MSSFKHWAPLPSRRRIERTSPAHLPSPACSSEVIALPCLANTRDRPAFFPLQFRQPRSVVAHKARVALFALTVNPWVVTHCPSPRVGGVVHLATCAFLALRTCPSRLDLPVDPRLPFSSVQGREGVDGVRHTMTSGPEIGGHTHRCPSPKEHHAAITLVPAACGREGLPCFQAHNNISVTLV
jgi:hypothetical protein